MVPVALPLYLKDAPQKGAGRHQQDKDQLGLAHGAAAQRAKQKAFVQVQGHCAPNHMVQHKPGRCRVVIGIHKSPPAKSHARVLSNPGFYDQDRAKNAGNLNKKCRNRRNRHQTAKQRDRKAERRFLQQESAVRLFNCGAEASPCGAKKFVWSLR